MPLESGIRSRNCPFLIRPVSGPLLLIYIVPRVSVEWGFFLIYISLSRNGRVAGLDVKIIRFIRFSSIQFYDGGNFAKSNSYPSSPRKILHRSNELLKKILFEFDKHEVKHAIAKHARASIRMDFHLAIGGGEKKKERKEKWFDFYCSTSLETFP